MYICYGNYINGDDDGDDIDHDVDNDVDNDQEEEEEMEEIRTLEHLPTFQYV